MLLDSQIEENKQRFLDLIKSITRENSDIDGLVDWLENKSDFFDAPGSAKHHLNTRGGLCLHSLNVYDCLVKLQETFKPNKYSDDTLKIVALLHDISKANYYTQYVKNFKTGEKDKNGKDIWDSTIEYKVRDQIDRFIYGSHEQNSEFMVSTFFNLNVEERTAILHHHGGLSFDSGKDLNEISAVFGRFNLATLLHLADMSATFLLENE